MRLSDRCRRHDRAGGHAIEVIRGTLARHGRAIYAGLPAPSSPRQATLRPTILTPDPLHPYPARSPETPIESTSRTRALKKAGVEFYGTCATAAFMAEAGVEATPVHWPLEKATPNALDLLREGGVDLVVNIPKDASDEELRNDYAIRRAAVDHGIPLVTNTQLAQRLAGALCHNQLESLEIRSWSEYQARREKNRGLAELPWWQGV